MTHPAEFLKNAWQIYGRQFKIWMILVSPLAALAALLIILGSVLPSNPAELFSAFPAAAIIGIFVFLIAGAVIISRTFMNAAIISANKSLDGGAPSINDGYHQGMKTFWPVLWVSILRGLLILAGLILLIVPGVIWALQYSLTTHVILLENKRGMAAFRRSKELTRGRLLEALIDFGNMSLVIAYGTWIILAAVMVCVLVLGSITSAISPAAGASLVNTIFFGIGIIAEVGVIWLVLPFSPLLFTAVYKDFANNK